VSSCINFLNYLSPTSADLTTFTADLLKVVHNFVCLEWNAFIVFYSNYK